MPLSNQKLLETLRCPVCGGRLEFHGREEREEADFVLHCVACGERFPVMQRIPVLIRSSLREALSGNGNPSRCDDPQVRTALSFGFEWNRFPEMYAEWSRTFLDYM